MIRDSDRLFRHSLLLMAATQVGNAANILFQIFMMRRLSPAIGEYGILASMLSLMLIVSTPLEALRTAVAHFSARLLRSGNIKQIRGLVSTWVRWIALIAIVLLIAGVGGRNVFARFFQLPSPTPIIMVSLIMACTLFTPLFSGVLQGVQAFGWLAIVGQTYGVVRLFVGMALVLWVSATALMGLCAQGMGALACIGLGWLAFVVVLRSWSQEIKASQTQEAMAPARDLNSVSGGLTYFVKSLIILFGYAVLMNADVSMVKHFFSPDETDLFATAATIGRAIIFLPMPIAAVMFPKVVSGGQTSHYDRKTLCRAFFYSGVFILAACLAASMLARFIWFVFKGLWPDPDSLNLILMLIWAMSPLGLTYLMMNFELAQHRFKFIWAIIPCAIAYVAGVSLWHDSLRQVIMVMGSMNLASLVILGFGMPWRARQRTSG